MSAHTSHLVAGKEGQRFFKASKESVFSAGKHEAKCVLNPTPKTGETEFARFSAHLNLRQNIF